jgi:hypothetical protein
MTVEERCGHMMQAGREAREQCVSGLASTVNHLIGSMLVLTAAMHKGDGPATPKRDEIVTRWH